MNKEVDEGLLINTRTGEVYFTETEKTKAPIDIDLLLGLLKFLDIEIRKHGCPHHHKLVVRFLKSQGVQNAEPVLQWLRNNGVYCDCGVLRNTSERIFLQAEELAKN